MTVSIRLLRDDHMRQLAGSLRRMDLLEVVCMVPDQPIDDVLVASGRASVAACAGFWNRELVACWGVAPRTADVKEGAPWLLATDAIERPEIRRAFLRHGTQELGRLTEGFSHLWNLVHRDNAVARRWLRFMGFEFSDSREYVISGEPFVRFEMRTV